MPDLTPEELKVELSVIPEMKDSLKLDTIVANPYRPGSTGQVYFIDMKDGREAVIKKSGDDKAKKRIREEWDNLSKLQGPKYSHIIQLLMPGFYEVKGDGFIVLERGVPLHKILDNMGGRANEETFLEVMDHVLKGFQSFHPKEIFHRDITKGNVIKVGEVYKIADFSEARGSEGTSGSAPLRGEWLSADIETHLDSQEKNQNIKDCERGASVPAEIHRIGCFMFDILAGYHFYRMICTNEKTSADAEKKVIELKGNGKGAKQAAEVLRKLKVSPYIVEAVRVSMLPRSMGRYDYLGQLAEALDKNYITSIQEAQTLYTAAIEQLKVIETAERNKYGIIKNPQAVVDAVQAVNGLSECIAQKELMGKSTIDEYLVDVGGRVHTLRKDQFSAASKIYGPFGDPIPEPTGKNPVEIAAAQIGMLFEKQTATTDNSVLEKSKKHVGEFYVREKMTVGQMTELDRCCEIIINALNI